ncbi:MAG: Lrp/AsnC family transcriptional regulator [Lachnospiraceae bacterium]|nr:Lrp/AsnC family transcriptional regulator [Lachnospiraceae bacterium]MDD3615939.1 Lrp/AsnC family transcriptional regulator [Lachnospiraceae bacterium]
MEQKKTEQILHLLAKDSRLTNQEIAVMLDSTEDEVAETVHQLEKDKIICGYHTLVDWNKVNDEDVTAVVELRVTPQGGDGYERIAEKIKDFPQVETLYLMSGTYDFLVMIKGTTLKEISLFVSGNLASMEEVQSTTTHFALTKYKELGVSFATPKSDKRMVVTP